MQELYVLGSDRSARFVRAFLDRFLPNRAPASEDYPVPEHADAPHAVFQTEGEVLAYLEQHPSEPYGLYWNHSDPASSAQAMAFYTLDGKVIFGLAEDPDVAAQRLQEMAAFVGTDHTLSGWEQRPPDTSEAFLVLCRR